MNAVAVVAVIVALALGALAGGLVEHQRAKDKSNKPSAVATTTTVAAASVWFGTDVRGLCPAAQQWYKAVGTAIYALQKKTTWDARKVELASAVKTADAAYRAMLPRANDTGTTELTFLRTSLGRTNALIKSSATEAAFFQAHKTVIAGRTLRDIGILVQAVKGCVTT